MDEEELFELFQKRLHHKLKDKINASVFVTISDNVLLVRIRKIGIFWELEIPNILEYIMYEKDTDKLEHNILKEFRRMILNTFFY